MLQYIPQATSQKANIYPKGLMIGILPSKGPRSSWCYMQLRKHPELKEYIIIYIYIYIQDINQPKWIPNLASSKNIWANSTCHDLGWLPVWAQTEEWSDGITHGTVMYQH